MAKTESTMLPLGTTAPSFSLPDTEGKPVSLEDARDAKAVLVMFICNHCPYVVHVAGELARLGQDYIARGVAVFGINANDATAYPDDSPARMVDEVKRRGYTFPYLFDETQAVAAAYHAACTPDFFLFDGARRLVYRGQLDDSRPGNGKPNNGRDLRAALDALLEGRPIEGTQKPSLGCNIKWRARE
ncbi:MAG: thioredoxin family protein [Deltaproteobacteria bacterium]|nr:thioredoxin family protein [Deltaproteobacteria bacterium]